MHVSAAASTESDCAGSGRRSRRKRPISSSARCAASVGTAAVAEGVDAPAGRNAAITRLRDVVDLREEAADPARASAACSARPSAADIRSGADPLERNRGRARRRRPRRRARLARSRSCVRRVPDRLRSDVLPHGLEQLLSGTARRRRRRRRAPARRGSRATRSRRRAPRTSPPRPSPRAPPRERGRRHARRRSRRAIPASRARSAMDVPDA